MPEPFGTRDRDTMIAYSKAAHAGELRAVRSEAERDGDRELVEVVTAELRRRGLE